MRLRSSSRTARPSGHKTRPGTGSSTEYRRSQLPPLLACRPPSRFGRSGSTSGFERSRSTSNPKSSWVWNGSRRFQVITGPSPGAGRNRRRASRHIGGTKRSPRPIPRNALPCCRSSESQPYSRRVAWLGLRPTACPSRCSFRGTMAQAGQSFTGTVTCTGGGVADWTSPLDFRRAT